MEIKEYLGPLLEDEFNNNSFCENFLPTGGFVKAKFVKIADGDTAFFTINGCNECVRFMVINAPKSIGEEEYYGIEATNYANTMLNNAKEIYLQSDKANNLRDDTLAQRLLAWIWVDGKLLNYLMTYYGYSDNKYILNENMLYLDYMRKAEEHAKEKKLGIHYKKC